MTEPSDELVLRGPTILTGTVAVTGHQIHIRDGRVHAIEPETPPPAGVTVLERPGTWVVAGLIDSHVHLGGTGVPGRDETEHTDPGRARPRLLEHLAHGVTTVADLFGYPPAMLARRADAAARPGGLPRILVGGQGVTNPGGHPTGTAYAWSPRLATTAALESDDPVTVGEHVRRLAEVDHVDLVKVTCSDLRGRVPRLSPGTLRVIVEQAHTYGLPVLAHIHTDDDALAALAAGVDGIEHLPVGPRMRAALAAIGEAGAYFTPTLAVMEAIAHAERPQEYLDRCYPDRPERLRPSARALVLAGQESTSTRATAARRILTAVLDGRVIPAGLRICAGTDAGNNYTPHGYSLHRELGLLEQAGLSTATVLAAATTVAADKLRRPDLGRVAAGTAADLLVLSADPRHDIAALRRIDVIIAAGRIRTEPEST